MSYDEPDPSPDGLACDLCGDIATSLIHLQGFEVKQGLCDSCRHDQITDCERCGAWMLQSQGTRVHNHGAMTCPKCMLDTPELVAGLDRELRRDIARDDFEQRRR